MLLCWCRLRAGLLALLLMVIGLPFARTPAFAGDDLFEVLDVHVDETDQTAAAARDKALAIGEQRAWDILMHRLVDPQAKKMPEFSASDISDAIKDFWVSEEKTSPVRYIATLNYNFRPDKVRALLLRRNVRFSTTQSPPVMIVPVYSANGEVLLWDDPNPWRETWQNVPSHGLVPLRVPVGDLTDLSLVNARIALSGDVASLQELAEHHNAGASLVTVATLEGSAAARQLKVSSTRYTQGNAESLPDRTFSVQGDQPSPELLQQAATEVAQDMEIAWRQGTTVMGSPTSTTSRLVVPAPSLADWVRVRSVLDSVPQIERMTVDSLSRDVVRVTIVYGGDIDQLNSALADDGLALHQEDDHLVLGPANAFVQPPQFEQPLQ